MDSKANQFNNSFLYSISNITANNQSPILTKTPVRIRISYQAVAAEIKYREAKLWLF